MKITQIVLLVVGALVIAVALGGCAVLGGYNQARQLDESVNSKWGQVESQLQRRYDLIPNLVATVKGITSQEQEVFLGIAKAREAYFQQKSPEGKAQAANQVESALSRLLFLSEKYPELKSNESFLKLQDELSGTENRIAVERQRYNEGVEQLNKFVRTFPGSFYARVAGVEQRDYFQIQDAAAEQPPKVDFSKPPAVDTKATSPQPPAGEPVSPDPQPQPANP